VEGKLRVATFSFVCVLNALLETDKPEEANLHKAMAALPLQSGTIRLVDRKDFYSAHGPDAIWMAQNFYKTNSILKSYGTKNIPYCTFSVAVACSFLREALTAKQLRVQIYVKDGGKVRLDKQASPGNFQDVESMLFNNVEILSAPIVAAIHFTNKANIITVGIAYADSSSREIGISQFVDNELFSNVESFIIQLGVKEMLIQENDAQKDQEAAKLTTLIDRCGVVITNRKKGELNFGGPCHLLMGL
jgi:DNA mismatch repair protein MSH2